MTTKMLPYAPGFSPRHKQTRTTRRRKTRRGVPAWVLVVLGLIALDPSALRAAFRDLRERWELSRPQRAADGDTDATETLRWLGRPYSGQAGLPRPVPFIARVRASTLLVGWVTEQTRPPVPDLVLYFRLWCLAEGISA